MKIMLADDSALIRSILREVVDSIDGMQVIAEAANGQKAVETALKMQPDLLIMDINMPLLTGIEAMAQIRQHSNLPILIFSSEVDAHKGFLALSHGALDMLKKPDLDKLNSPEFIADFKARLENLLKQSRLSNQTDAEGLNKPCTGEPGQFSLVGIGASTGGPVAIKSVLENLPADFPCPIAVVQHLEEGFEHSYAAWLDMFTPLSVKVAAGGEKPEVGNVYISPIGKHLAVRNGLLCLDDTPKVLNQKPAVDVLFRSCAQYYGQKFLAVLLTGMGRDGASGCIETKKCGGFVVVQNQASSTIFGMPKAAIEAGAACTILDLLDIPGFLYKKTGGEA